MSINEFSHCRFHHKSLRPQDGHWGCCLCSLRPPLLSFQEPHKPSMHWREPQSHRHPHLGRMWSDCLRDIDIVVVDIIVTIVVNAIADLIRIRINGRIAVITVVVVLHIRGSKCAHECVDIPIAKPSPSLSAYPQSASTACSSTSLSQSLSRPSHNSEAPDRPENCHHHSHRPLCNRHHRHLES